MVVHLLWIINQSGQLIARLGFTEPALLGELGTKPDLQLTLSSVLFSTYGMSLEITPNVNPMDSSGMHLVECEEHNIHIYETPTLVKFVLVSDNATMEVNKLCRELHAAYVEYAVKNPFHIMDEAGIGQPIRIPDFSAAVRGIVGRYNSGAAFTSTVSSPGAGSGGATANARSNTQSTGRSK
ncbi:component of TRAPP complex [Strigomonas culicis]|uniref:Trafficking protein particle complex subunit n=1 Tax=Strigomonas culicis TaxID=28005 RepID=S9V3R0_9TRYP|nr:component of TRAPP complex [Strigomonas culicis]|eukprot:EPY35649.1 component of TRAPP complex [Strigomonas culicis]